MGSSEDESFGDEEVSDVLLSMGNVPLSGVVCSIKKYSLGGNVMSVIQGKVGSYQGESGTFEERRRRTQALLERKRR